MTHTSAVGNAVVVSCFAAFAADSSRTEKLPVAVDPAQFADFMANEALDVWDLAEGAEIQRRIFNHITPPGVSLLQPMFPAVVPFDAANFDAAFLEDLLGEDKNTVAIYPLSLALDPKTRETLVCNAEGTLIAVLPAERDFRAWRDDADPARVTLQLDLLPSEDVEPYLYAESRIAENTKTGNSKSAKGGGVAKMSLGEDQFGIADILRLTNGNMRLTLTNWTVAAEVYAYTVWYTSSVAVATWMNEESNVVTDTNTVWTPDSPPYNGIEGEWECLASNQYFSGGAAVWEDVNISSNARIRFYATVKQVDSDGDDLTDGAEIFLHRTDPGLVDTDSDGIPDGAEIGLGLDPLDAADAAEDPDADELTNQEEWELGTDLFGSNVVQKTFFVNQLPAMGLRSAGIAHYMTWTNFQAKAAYTEREKEGFQEFTSEEFSASEPPKWYLTSERILSQSTYFHSSYTNYINQHSSSNFWYCQHTFDPAGSNAFELDTPSPGPSNHICRGHGHQSGVY